MIYRELLASYGVELFDEKERKFTPRQLASGWAWWAAQPFAAEGLCRNKETGHHYRLTSTTEIRGRLQYRVYSIGPAVKEVA